MTKSFMTILAALSATMLLAGVARAQESKPEDKPKTTQPAPADKKDDKPAGGGSGGGTSAQPAEKAPEKAVSNVEYVKLTTRKGDIYLKLDRAKAPISTENFLKYVDKKYYDGTIFHRVIPSFMVQGGGFTSDMKPKEGQDKPISNEWQNGLKNKRGSVSMARTANPNSATSQFFINNVDNPFLDQPRDGAAYAVFGEVVAGMEVVDEITKVKTTSRGGNENVPVEPVTITSATRVKETDVPKK